MLVPPSGAAPTNSALRPADILLRAADTRPVAVDVTVVHPLRPSTSLAAREPAYTAAAAEKAKETMYGTQCRTAGWSFKPCGFETTGAWGPKATSLCKRLAKALSMRLGDPASATMTSVSIVVSTALAKGRGEMLVMCFPL